MLNEAEKSYLTALKTDSRHSINHYRLDRLLIKNKRFDQEAKHILKVVDLEPENPAHLETLSGEFERSGKLLEVANILERPSMLEADRFEIHMRLGDIYKKKKIYQTVLTPYCYDLPIKGDESYIRRIVLEIYKALSDLEIKRLKGHNSSAQKH
jgi:hypothetical protein